MFVKWDYLENCEILVAFGALLPWGNKPVSGKERWGVQICWLLHQQGHTSSQKIGWNIFYTKIHATEG